MNELAFGNAKMKQKNTWGTSTGPEQQRSDLFQVVLSFPSFLTELQGSAWETECRFAVEQFPFPPREREMIPVKYLNQTNFLLGADTASAPVDITVRYAFNTRTAELLERWSWLTSNPKTGAVALSSHIKTDGYFYWLVPDLNELKANPDSEDVLRRGGRYKLEGCMVRGLQPGAANMAEGNGLVNLTFSLQIDRYYPESPEDLYVTSAVI